MSFLGSVFKVIFFPFLFLIHVLFPRSKKNKPDAVKDLENPVAEAGKPIPVVFGTITVKGLNVLWFGDKSQWTFKVDA